MKSGDILWFITSKTTTNKTSIVIGMAEYVNMCDWRDETIIALNTYTNEEMGWSTDTNWDIQITYKNLYCGNNIEKHNFYTPFKCPSCIMNLTTFQDKTPIDFKNEYQFIIKYSEPNKYFK